MTRIKCSIFKMGGEYYTDRNVYIPDNTCDSEVTQQINHNRVMKNMIYVGKTPIFNIPFLVGAI